jgi:hypothetical protein
MLKQSNIPIILTMLIALTVGGAGGFIMGKDQAADTSQGNPGKTPAVNSITVKTYIEPYTGVGSGVLKHGTIIRGDYKGPDSIVGQFNPGTEDEFPGTWVIRKVVTE